MTWAYLGGTQPKALAETALKLPRAFTELPKAIDALLRIPCLFLPPQDNTGYWHFAQTSLMSIGHTAGATYYLWSQAFYLEAALMVRNMLEVLVQLRYFGKHRDEYMPHVLPVRDHTGRPIKDDWRPKKQVKFKRMFDDVAPGFYQEHYGEVLSNIAHGGLVASFLRLDLNKLAKTTEPVFGCVYDEWRARLVLAYFQIGIHGLINMGLELDPALKDRDDGTHRAVIDDALDFLNRSLDEDWRVPGKRPLLKSASGLIGWTIPAE
jgi:hypothetical protein